MSIRFVLSLLPVIAASACANESPIPDKSAAIDGARIDKVLALVKQEIGWFLYDSVQVDTKWPALLTDLGTKNGDVTIPVTPVCGTGKIQFDVISVNMSFDRSITKTNTANAGFILPFGPAGIGAKATPSVSGSQGRTDRQSLSYIYKPPTLTAFKRVVDTQMPAISDEEFAEQRKDAIIMPALNALRDGLIRTTQYFPCFTNTNEKDKEQTLTLKVDLVETGKGSLGVKLVVADFGGSQEKTAKTGNTITVNFRAINPPKGTAPGTR